MDWIEKEYGSLEIGDTRLNNRAKQLLKRFSDRPMESIPGSCKGWAETKAAYRFFENESVTAKKIIKPHRVATLNRIKEHPVVLLLEDTTTLNYSGQKERQDTGPTQQDQVLSYLVRGKSARETGGDNSPFPSNGRVLFKLFKI